MKISSNKDYFNKKRTRNENNCSFDEYNCGGYALGTFNWYLPYEKDKDFWYESNIDFINDLLDTGWSIEEATEKILDKNIEQMLKQFSNLEVIEKPTDENDIIAYRLSVMADEEFYGEEPSIWDMDFHFLLYHDGQWTHKNGKGAIEKFEGNLYDVWNIDSYFEYNSPIRFLRRASL